MFLTHMEEEYNLIYSGKGRNKANRWLWSHLLRSLSSFLKTNLTWSLNMFTNYLKVALRNIRRHKIYSFINIFGLAVGMACFILIMLFVQYEFSYEKQHKNLDRIYRLNIRYLLPNETVIENYTQAPLADVLINEIPEIKSITRFARAGSPLLRYKDKYFYEPGVIFTDVSTFEIFTFPFINGNKTDALKDKYSLVITQEKAEKYFGDEDPVGKVITLNGSIDLTVTGVIENIPENSMFQYGFFISYPTIEDVRGSRFLTNRLSIVLQTFVLLSPDVNPDNILNKANFVFQNFYTGEEKVELIFDPLKRIHLYSEIDDYGSIRYIYIFSIAALFIILIACINYMNLSTARSEKRAREIGIRKVVGASRTALVKQFFGETIIYTLISLFAAVIIVFMLLPSFRDITGQDIQLEDLTGLIFILGLPLITLFVGFVSGSYPAVFLSSFKPVKVLKEVSKSHTKDVNFRKILIVVQFAVSITLIICTFIISKQLDYLKHKDVGFNKNQLLVIRIRGDRFRENIEPLKNELIKYSHITGVSFSSTKPIYGGFWRTMIKTEKMEEPIRAYYYTIDPDFIHNFDIELITGRNFSDAFSTDKSSAILLNKKAVQALNLSSPEDALGQTILLGESGRATVIGIVGDFNYRSLENPINPLVMRYKPEDFRFANIRYTPGKKEDMKAFLVEIWKKFDKIRPANYIFIEDEQERYNAQISGTILISAWACGFVILISLLGLLGMSMYTTEMKVKEIGIRKVLGSNVFSITCLLSKGYIRLICISAAFALPGGFLLSKSMLQFFAFRPDMNLWVLPGTLIFILALAMLTIGSQVLRAAQANPVDTLKVE